MGLPQEINPVNSELMDTLVETSKMDWMQYVEGEERAFVKIFIYWLRKRFLGCIT